MGSRGADSQQSCELPKPAQSQRGLRLRSASVKALSAVWAWVVLRNEIPVVRHRRQLGARLDHSFGRDMNHHLPGLAARKISFLIKLWKGLEEVIRGDHVVQLALELHDP